VRAVITMANLPNGSTVVIEGINLGDEDFMYENGPWINVTKAFRILKEHRAPQIAARIPRAQLPELRERIDVNPDHLLALRANKARLLDPGLLVEVEPGVHNLMDGHHRLFVLAELYPNSDPLQMMCYFVPHWMLPAVTVRAYEIRPDSTRVEISHAELMKQSWGKYTNGERRT
jgi:hypothetical protein